MRFWLGTDRANWLETVPFDLFVSHRILAKRKTLPGRPQGQWALDSGGFTEINLYGNWKTGVNEYIEATERYMTEIPGMVFASPQDWMCEPSVRKRTGKTTREHQALTVENYLQLQRSGLPFIPALQGWEHDEYLEHIDLYQTAGIDLRTYPLVGLGSMCRRQGLEAAEILRDLHDYGINLHGYGYKKSGLRKHNVFLASADSMAWSYAARYQPPLPGCPHQCCNHCLKFATLWREDIIQTVAANRVVPPIGTAKCSVCHETRAITAFTADRRRKNGIGGKCQACKNQQNRERYPKG